LFYSNYLNNNPLWRPEDLGKPIPDSPHAVSACMPTWQDVIDYEEGSERIQKALPSGYPRFVIHPFLKELFELGRNIFTDADQDCFAFPSKAVAERALKYLQKNGFQQGLQVQALGKFNIHFLVFPKNAFEFAKEYWQHTGEIVSSRLAEAVLSKAQKVKSGGLFSDISKKIVRERIAEITDTKTEDVYLFVSGMAAIFTAHRMITQINRGQKTVQFGFPYVDTYKIGERFGAGSYLFPFGNQADLQKLIQKLSEEKLAGVFVEFPGNPLLQSINLTELASVARRHAMPVILDDTIATFANVQTFPQTDILVTSLTKFFSGEGDAMGGSLVLSRESPFYAEFKTFLNQEFEDLLYETDAQIIEQHSGDFAERIKQINHNAQILCEYLKAHSKVQEVYYPKFQATENYLACKRPSGGYGGLFSVLLKNAPISAPVFYDGLQVCKGPSLGTNYTLACPYTLLAHYNELSFAQECGVSPYLVRVSVGLEDANDLVRRFEAALAKV
jgi:cystathionine gamma-synthase